MRKRRGAGWYVRRGETWYVGYYNETGDKIRESTGCKKPARKTAKGEERPPKEVEDFLRERLNQLDNGNWIHPTKTLTFDDLVDLVRAVWRQKHRRSTVKTKRGLEQSGIRRLRAVFGHLDARSITSIRMDAYVDDRLNEGASVSAVRNEINFLKRGLRQAWKKKLLPTLPSFPELVIPDETIRKGFFERAEFDRLLVELPEYMRGVATFMYWTGWRSKSEVLTRQWRHVDLAKGLVHLEAGETKNREPRLFPFRVHPELSAAIDAQRAYTDRMQKELGIVIPWLFHRRGRRFGRAFWTQWKEACTRAGLPGRIPHDFRRTAARNLVEHAGVTEKVAMQLTGHKTANVFERYHITINDDLKAAVAKLAAAPSLAATTPDRSVIPMVDPTRTQKAVGE